MKELIEALRCSASPYSKNVDCKSCRYRLLEPVSDKIPVLHNTVIDEVKYWESCDVDRIALDAADALEKQEVYKWIHVSERLPETDDLMLVSCRTKKGVNESRCQKCRCVGEEKWITSVLFAEKSLKH